MFHSLRGFGWGLAGLLALLTCTEGKLLCPLGTEAKASPISRSLPLPRFVSLRSGRVNVHVGPGQEYPVEWMLQRQSLPVEILAEFDIWRKIRTHDGTSGWIHKSLLVGKRTVIFQGPSPAPSATPGKEDQNMGPKLASKNSPSTASASMGKEGAVQSVLSKISLYQRPEETSKVVAYVVPGVIGQLKECQKNWCKVKIKDRTGWAQRSSLWGVYPHEEKL